MKRRDFLIGGLSAAAVMPVAGLLPAPDGIAYVVFDDVPLSQFADGGVIEFEYGAGRLVGEILGHCLFPDHARMAGPRLSDLNNERE